MDGRTIARAWRIIRLQRLGQGQDRQGGHAQAGEGGEAVHLEGHDRIPFELVRRLSADDQMNTR